MQLTTIFTSMAVPLNLLSLTWGDTGWILIPVLFLQCAPKVEVNVSV